MATIDYPAGKGWIPSSSTIGVSAPGTSWAPPYSGPVQTVSNFNDRLTARLSFPPVRNAIKRAQREAFWIEVKTRGHILRMHRWDRPYPNGTISGSPTVTSDVLAGATSISLSGLTPGATVVGGDMLGIGGKLLQVGYAGATANGSGVMVVPLSIATLAAISAAAAVTWSKPTGTWQVIGFEPQLTYEPGILQLGPEVMLVAV